MGTPLTVKEIETILKEFTTLTEHVMNIHKKNTLFEHIQLPKTPTILTESIAYYLVKNKKILPNLGFSALRFNEKATKHLGTSSGNTDLIAMVGQQEYLIEVKGTRKPSQFTAFSEKDIDSDCAIWIDYGDLFTKKQSTIEVAVIENPKSAGLKAKKYTWTSKSFTKLKVLIKKFPSIAKMIK
jgi:hypothetical protein